MNGVQSRSASIYGLDVHITSQQLDWTSLDYMPDGSPTTVATRLQMQDFREWGSPRPGSSRWCSSKKKIERHIRLAARRHAPSMRIET